MQLDFNDFIVPEFDIHQIFTFGENMYNISTDDEKNPNYLAHSYKIETKKTVALFDKNKIRIGNITFRKQHKKYRWNAIFIDQHKKTFNVIKIRRFLEDKLGTYIMENKIVESTHLIKDFSFLSKLTENQYLSVEFGNSGEQQKVVLLTSSVERTKVTTVLTEYDAYSLDWADVSLAYTIYIKRDNRNNLLYMDISLNNNVETVNRCANRLANRIYIDELKVIEIKDEERKINQSDIDMIILVDNKWPHLRRMLNDLRMNSLNNIQSVSNICDRKNKNNEINIDLIETITTPVQYNKNILTYVRSLNQNQLNNKGNAVLDIYKDIKSGYMFAIKKAQPNDRKSKKAIKYEIDILNHLKKNGTCDLIKFKVIGEMIVSPLMDGDLEDLIEKNILGFKNVIQIIKTITEDMLCLIDDGIYYTDLKPENILYRCNNGNDFSLVIGDLGSLSSEKFGNNRVFYTYFPTDIQHTKRSLEYVMWLIVLLSLRLCMSKFDFDSERKTILAMKLDKNAKNRIYTKIKERFQSDIDIKLLAIWDIFTDTKNFENSAKIYFNTFNKYNSNK